MAKEKLNPGHYDELVERLRLLSYYLNRQLIALPVIYQNKEWQGHVNAILVLTESLESIANVCATNERRLDDLAYTLCETIYDHLVIDEQVATDPIAAELAEKAGDALWKLYQHFALKYHNEDANTKSKPNSAG